MVYELGVYSSNSHNPILKWYPPNSPAILGCYMMVAYGIPGGCSYASYAAVSLRITANGRRIVTLAHLRGRAHQQRLTDTIYRFLCSPLIWPHMIPLDLSRINQINIPKWFSQRNPIKSQFLLVQSPFILVVSITIKSPREIQLYNSPMMSPMCPTLQPYNPRTFQIVG